MPAANAPGFFCDHKRLRTSCPECKPAPPPKPEPAPPEAPAAASTAGDADGKKKRAPARRRTRVKPPTRDEAEQAEAWWVRS